MDDTTLSKYASLITTLYRLTQRKAIAWTLDDNRRPVATVAGYTVTLYSGMNHSGPMEYMAVATLFDEPIETVSDEDLSEVAVLDGSHDSYYFLMEDLRQRAFRQAVGADDALAKILDELKGRS